MKGKMAKKGNIQSKSKVFPLACMGSAVVLLFFVCLFVGSSGMSAVDSLKALFGEGTPTALRIIRNIRLPRVLAALIAGAGLSVSGLIMQTVLANSMASPSTLGVTNGAVFGANLSIIALAGGFLSTGNNLSGYGVGANPFAVSASAFVFAVLSVLIILGLSSRRSFSTGAVVLAGIAMGSVWTALTSIMQFYATDVGLSSAVLWTFGDLGRASYKTDLIMLSIVLSGIAFFWVLAWRYNGVMCGDATALSMGINVNRLRFVSLLISSLITAVCVSFLGIIGFVGIICPHIVKKLLGHDHRLTIPASVLSGSILLLLADTLSRTVGGGSALPVGAITTLLGAPFFLFIIITGKGKREC